MPTRTEIVAAARGCLGVRWRHLGRDPATGLDCIGLLIVVARRLGIEPADRRYGRLPRDAGLHAALERQLVRVHRPPLQGDVGLFSETIYPFHAGIFSEAGGRLHLIHASAPRRKVVEEPFVFDWPARLRGLFEYPGVSG